MIAVATWSVLVAMASSEQAAPTLASPALAVKAGRERGASVLEKRRMEEEAAAAADEAAAAKRQKKSRSVARVPAVAVVDQALPNGVGIQGRGRATINAPLADGSNCVAAMQQRRQSLLAAAEFRPTRKVVAVAPAGAGKFDGMPDRDEYAAGAEGEAAFARDFEQFVESNFDGKGVELRTIDQHELKAGFFGAWYERGGHGKKESKGGLGNVISGNYCGKKAPSEDFSQGNKRCRTSQLAALGWRAVLDRVRLAGGPSSASTGAEPEGPAPGVVRGGAAGDGR